ncbi:uncharacterized protein CcaverHIS019_0407840 [Cutaneotrichosporon cavernicola]|uniref:Uncharacterized protein n=1 Tax=Cutaneotrichosporon cavernicola TaxID=279322 RepID=A0AA48QW18_9TREE|nr:uncharacterized protein CcaverHIS019_0407840 [Cutaneotrichosporon cavernicola]BEI91964.1 hypothetical protein CcaverHIS019_0407840 [Cutaneotrichosporon cavernicola]BEI99735.1 hypothetical protein CcaverHIS631_0407780 [Cutaneotrichosporon cavernicola]BEJ07511.1 hypothetical protein CcaverHIS641_0407800 [Cutaneotrichosporon cavernicola]
MPALERTPFNAPRLTLDTTACAAVFERARSTDLLILCFGIALGILFYAIAHDLSHRRWRDRDESPSRERSRGRPRSSPLRERSRSLADSPPPYTIPVKA